MAKSKGPMKTVQRGVRNANNALAGLQSVLEAQSAQLEKISSGSRDVQEQKSTGGIQQQIMLVKLQQAQLELQKDSTSFLKKISEGQRIQIEDFRKGNKDWKTFGDKMRSFTTGIKDALDPDNIKKAMLGPFSMFKGVRNKMEDADFSKRMKAMGDVRSRSELKQVSKQQRADKREAGNADEKIERLKKMGANEEDIRASNPELFKNRDDALKRVSQANIAQTTSKPATPAGNFTGDQPSAKLVELPSDKGQLPQSTTDMAAEEQQRKERDLESQGIFREMRDYLAAIAASMSGDNNSAAGGKEDKGPGGGGAGAALGGLLGGAIGGLGEGLGKFAESIGKGAGNGIAGLLRGIASGLASLANPATLVGLGAATLAIMGIGKALEFAAPAFEAMAPVMMKVAEVFGVIFVAAIEKIPEIVTTIGDVIVNVMRGVTDGITQVIDTVVTSIERLAAIDGGNLALVGASLLAVSAGIAAFAGANVVGGLGNLVGGFLNAISGGKNPIEQMQMMADMGPKLEQAGIGIEKVAAGMVGFKDLSKDDMEAVSKFPWEAATKFVAAGGSVTVRGTTVTDASKANADANAKSSVVAPPPAPVVSTQVNNNSSSNTTVKPSVRNMESSLQRYSMSRY